MVSGRPVLVFERGEVLEDATASQRLSVADDGLSGLRTLLASLRVRANEVRAAAA